MTNCILTYDYIERVLFGNEQVRIHQPQVDAIERCYEFLENFAKEKVIYGINTGFGPMAQWRVDDKYLHDLQYNIIRSHATGAGEPLPDIYVRGAMIARLGTFLQAHSGIHIEVVKLLIEFINRGIYPFIPEHGSVGASGDLVQLAHIALTMIGEGKVHYKGQWCPSADVMRECGLKPFSIHVREGLSITNGTSVMTGIALVNQHYAEKLLHWAMLASVWMNEIAASYDDFMSEALNSCRQHNGQQTVACKMREMAQGGTRMKKREHMLYTESAKKVDVFEHKVQGYYSLRCTPQILGPIYDVLATSRQVLEEEVNSACDNPIIDPETQNVLHGGNFHGDYISIEQDKVKMAITRLTMTAERQLNYLFHDRINDHILPPFLNMGTLGLNYGMQACQFTATSTTAECQTLSMPNYVHSIPNNNDNQDIVSMGTNSALLCKRVIENACQVMSIHLMALTQATTILGIRDELCPSTRQTFDDVRALVPTFVEDTPFYEEIAAVMQYIKNLKSATTLKK